jgi:hypothetical protein
VCAAGPEFIAGAYGIHAHCPSKRRTRRTPVASMRSAFSSTAAWRPAV